MSYKSTNGIKLIKCDSQQWKTASLLDSSVKFAGEEAKDRLYEPKHKKKLVRVLTVVAYVFFVSLAAIMLSLYYVFLWNGDQKAKYVLPQSRQQRQYLSNKCDSILADLQQQITALEAEENTFTSTPGPATEESVTFSDDYEISPIIIPRLERSRSIFIKKNYER
ncbi:hypothetical protein NQ317_014252 [Molorchus minor]|uniref:Uncharacterized protein n=1 Tax=Molorchus minor TaxID=1323400 RepID=A0ABQ9J6I4_9CUCU|nr:hypothetical protein NQ317_014252 [Molorchus minor]